MPTLTASECLRPLAKEQFEVKQFVPAGFAWPQSVNSKNIKIICLGLI
jgi:hypothetical protein